MQFTKRDPIVMAILILITFGIYTLYWFVKTKRELNNAGAEIPTAWLLIIPFANIYWIYQFAYAFSKFVLKRNDKDTIVYFVLLVLLEPIGQIICQVKMNKAA